MILTNEQVKGIISNMDISYGEDNEIKLNNITYIISEVENEGWRSQSKWETNYYIYELKYQTEGSDFYESTGVYIGQSVSRSGSYYSEYYYEYETFEIVEQIEKTIVVKEWVVKE